MDHRVEDVLAQVLAELRTVHVRCCAAATTAPHTQHVCVQCESPWPCRETQILDRAETALGHSGSWETEATATVTPATTMSDLADQLRVDPDRLVTALTTVVREPTPTPIPKESDKDPS